jgi:short-subunit dehydrogenase
MNQTWIILGASSAMARAFARRMAVTGANLILCGRDKGDIERIASDAALRGEGTAEAMPFDASDPGTFAPIIEAATKKDGQINVAVFAGTMPEQSAIDADPSILPGVIETNFTGLVRFLHMLAPELEARESGVVVGVGSVAGDRGRLGNYVYGSAKAGFHAYLSGLRNRLGRKGVQVLTVKPGFVDTGMTWGIEGMFLVASPDDVAESIEKAIHKKRNSIYTPWFWLGIMTIIRTIPEFVFKKLKI